MVAKLLRLEDLSFESISLIVQLFLTIIFLSASTAVNTSSKLSKSLDFQNFEKFNATPQEIAPNFYAQTQFVPDFIRTPHCGQQLVSSMLGDKLRRVLDGI